MISPRQHTRAFAKNSRDADALLDDQVHVRFTPALVAQLREIALGAAPDRAALAAAVDATPRRCHPKPGFTAVWRRTRARSAPRPAR